MTRRVAYRRLESLKRFRRYRCRCSHCEHRATFRDNPKQMSPTPRCSLCRSRAWRVDWYRTTRRESRRYFCDCVGRPFPHRKGSCFYDPYKGDPAYRDDYQPEDVAA
jgi:hypothetical protein